VADASPLDRTIYNCFLNAATSSAQPTAGRCFTSLDMFPTILAAMGFTIEGERLGLGVSMFSSHPTLSETFGYSYLDQELNKFSEYYVLNFS
jgi:phosphoglycerol transferase